MKYVLINNPWCLLEVAQTAVRQGYHRWAPQRQKINAGKLTPLRHMITAGQITSASYNYYWADNSLRVTSSPLGR